MKNNIELDLMYRDGCNFKTSEMFVLSNKNRISKKRIKALMEHLMKDSRVMGYYCLPNLAPIDNEFLPISNGSEDHSFCEVCDYQFTDAKADEDFDISEAVDLFETEGYLQKEADAKDECISLMVATIKQLSFNPDNVAKNMLEDSGYLTMGMFHISDIHTVCKDNELPELTNGQAKEVLDLIGNKHDAEIGINWEVIRILIEDYCKDNGIK